MLYSPKSRVPVLETDKTKDYYKYFHEDMVAAPPEKYAKVAKPLDPTLALPFNDRNRLFEPGYLESEIGYCVMPDGTGYVSNLTPMPGVTPEMFDWWMAWHALDTLRYSIWNPEDHYSAKSMQIERAKDPDLNLREKYWDTTHFVIENVGLGPEEIFINFKHPRDLGFDAAKIDTPACGTLVCARGHGKGQPPFASLDTTLCHFIRVVEGGVELRTRFWMGWIHDDGRDIKALPDGMRMPIFGPMMLCLHNIKEFAHLASLLPRVYAEQKDNF